MKRQFLHNSRPFVRIGMIQSSPEITFRCDSRFRLENLDGRKLTEEMSAGRFTARIVQSHAARRQYGVRVAVTDTLDEAKQRQQELQNRGFRTDLWRQGLQIQIGNHTFDNREHWIVTHSFDAREQAIAFSQDFEPVGEARVVHKISQKASGAILFEKQEIANGIRIIPEKDGFIFLQDVPVGIEFHWQHSRTQKLPGVLEIRINPEGQLVAINELDIEDYLISVNSSEMTAENPPELLKAQTIAARSTILATMGKHHYDADFDLCSDDHCQCYHGVEKISDASVKAANETLGEILMYEDKICDARYAKICGGIMEDFANVWENRRMPYLQSGIDGRQPLEYPVDSEEKVMRYIDSEPDVYCNIAKYPVDSALPYNTKNLFRWQIEYSREELQEIIRQKMQPTDIGELVDILPGKRGASGRLMQCDIVGSKKTIRVGKELEIRRLFSKSHLYSACFYIQRTLQPDGKISAFKFIGAGWGHGVGLCQVGATVMAQLGFDYQKILSHYYKKTRLLKIYKGDQS